MISGWVHMEGWAVFPYVRTRWASWFGRVFLFKRPDRFVPAWLGRAAPLWNFPVAYNEFQGIWAGWCDLVRGAVRDVDSERKLILENLVIDAP